MAYPPPELPSEMRAWTLSRAGLPPKTLQLSRVAVPSLPTATSVLVRVSHCALHPGTCIMAQIVPFLFRKRPAIAETDFSGTVVAVGDRVPTTATTTTTTTTTEPSAARAFPVGTAVFGTVAVPAHLGSGSGALAEYVAVECSHIAAKPDAVPFDAAAGCGVSAATALVLVDAARLRPGGRVLVYAPCGGIGNFATQLARQAVGSDGTVVGVCSSANAALATELGCDEIVPYDRVPGGAPLPQHLAEHHGLDSEGGGFDAIIDAYGSQALWHSAARYLKAGREHPYASVGVKGPIDKVTFSGMFWSVWGMVMNSFWPVWLGGVPRKYSQIAMFVDDRIMERVRGELETGAVKPHVGGRWKFEDAKQAYVEYLDGHARGKLVVEVHDMGQ